METTAALTSNTFKITGNLKPLDKDIVQLQQDYEIMKKNRDKPKQIYNLIKLLKQKQMFIKWAVELNVKIQAFQNQQYLYFKLQFIPYQFDLEIKHNDQHISFKNLAMAKLITLDSDIVKLNQAIEQEKLDSIRTEKRTLKIFQNLLINCLVEKQISAANEKKTLNTIKITSQSN